MRVNVTEGTATDNEGGKHKVRVLEIALEQGKAGIEIFLEIDEAERVGDALKGKAMVTPARATPGNGLVIPTQG